MTPPLPNNGRRTDPGLIGIGPGAALDMAQRRRNYGRKALDDEAARVAASPPGERNCNLNAAAFALGQIVGADLGALSETEAVSGLLAAARAAGLPECEANRTIVSGIKAGMAHPRGLTTIGTTAPASRAPGSRPPNRSRRHLETDAANNRSRAIELWRGTSPVSGTAAEIYLRARGIVGELPSSLRFHRDVAMPDGGRHPCLIAAVTDPATGDVLAIQRTALRADGSAKAAIEPAKAALGSTRGGAVVFGELKLGEAIIEGEGVETVLSGCDVMGWPGVATLSCEALGKPPLPADRPVVILVDRGAEEKARLSAKRRHEEGRSVRLALMPHNMRPGQLGTDANDLLRECGPDAVRAMIEAAIPYRPDPQPPGLAPLPPGFRRRAGGWIEFAIGPADDAKDGETVWLELCSPLDVLAAARDADGDAWGRLVRVQNPDGQWGERLIPMSMLAGDGREVRAELLAAGLSLAQDKRSQSALMRLLNSVPSARALSVARLGWHCRAYVLPDAIIGDTGRERIIWQPAARVPHAYRVGGTLAGWRTEVAEPAIGNSRLVLAISCAFAAPLLTPLGLEGGGFHVRGPSSIGKTTLLRVAGSVWGGGGLDGFVRRWKATANGLEGVAALHNDGLLCLDELSEIEPRDASRAAYMLANGQGKQRAGRAGEARAPQTWRVFFLSSGELSLADKIAEDGQRAKAGQEVRVIDLPADAGAALGLFETLHGAADANAFARCLGEASGLHYGHPIRAFLKAFADDFDGALGRARAIMKRFEAEQVPAGASGQVRRVLVRFAAVAAAGELAAQFGILPWPAEEAVAGAVRCWRDWLAARGGAGDQEAARAIAQVRAFIEAHGSSRFVPVGNPDLGASNRAVFRTTGPDGEPRWMVLPQVWKTDVCRGLDPAYVARTLGQRGMLNHDQGTWQSRSRSPGLGRVRVYAIRPTLFGEPDIASDAQAHPRRDDG